MEDGLYEEAIVDVVGPETLASEPYAVKVIHITPLCPVSLLNGVPGSRSSGYHTSST